MGLVFIVLGVITSDAAAESLPEKVERLLEEGKLADAKSAAAELVSEREAAGRKLAPAALPQARQMLGQLQDMLGDHAAAAATLTKALEEFSAAQTGAAELGSCADAAGLASHAAGNFAQADDFLRRALTWRRSAGDAGWTAATLTHLGDLNLKRGRLEEAAEQFREATVQAPAGSEAKLLALHRTGVLHHTVGAYDDAIATLTSAARLATPSPANAAAIENDLGLACFRAGRLEEAAAHFASAEQKLMALSSDLPPETLLSCANNLATLLLQRGRPQEALQHLESALAKARSRPGLAENAALLAPLQNLGVAAHRSGNLAAAEKAFAEFRTGADGLLPPVHLLRVQYLQNAAALAADAGRSADAAVQAAESFRLSLQWLEQLVSFGAEERLLEFRRTVDPISPLAAFAAKDTAQLATAVFLAKNRSLDEALRLRRWSAGLSGELAAAWRTAAAELESLTLSEGPSAATTVAARDRLDALRHKLPGQPKAAVISCAAVQESLPPDAVLVDFIRFQAYQGKGTWDAAGHYGVVTLGKTGEAHWTDLGPAPAIDDLVKRILAKGAETIGTAGGSSGVRLTSLLSRLGKALWEKILPQIAGANRLLIRPDGLLHFAPWAVLLTPDSSLEAPVFFCQRYPQAQVIAFPAAQPKSTAATEWRLLAVPERPAENAGEPPENLTPPMTPQLWRQLSRMPPLAGVKKETAALQAAAQAQKAVLQVVAPANEMLILPAGTAPPAVLHLSGHGFALPDPAGGGSDALALYRSGLVLSDCAAGLSARAKGTPKVPAADGILFAAEAAGLPLTGTRLVVLSACQTGVGRPEAGEHLAGLRRAFLVAGADNVAASLWDLDDAQVPVFVAAFYEKLAHQPPSAALWLTQRESLESAKTSIDLRAAHAGAWIIESSGWEATQ